MKLTPPLAALRIVEKEMAKLPPASEENELKYMVERLKTDGGIRKLKRLIRNSFPREYRAAG